jgi:2-oxo-4-hydroxy-4-carboxy-5-ureidoimidazoline decarboxylase
MESWRRLDLASPDDAREALRTCCGSSRWIDRMIVRRPFATAEGLLQAAREEWFSLTPADWREAFEHHPKIGDRGGARRPSPATAHLSEREQAGVNAAPADVLTALTEGNQAYESKFGFIFIICATGRSARDMLTALRERLKNDPLTEIRIAAEEQARITELRLLQLS